MRLHRIPAHFAPQLVDGSGRLTLFRFLEQFYSSPARSNVNKRAVFLAYAQASGPLPEHEALALKLDLTRERVRQLVEAQERSLPRELPPLLNIPGWEERYPQLILQAPVHVADGSLMRVINAEEGTNWSPYFEGHLLRMLNAQTHVQVAWNEVGVAGRAGRRMDLERSLLVRRSMLVEFHRSLVELKDRINAPRTEALAQDLDSFVRAVVSVSTEEMASALTAFIPAHYGDLVGDDGRLHLPVNSRPDRVELLKVVLEELNEPSSVDRIVAAWNARFPLHPTHASMIRSLVHLNTDLFLSIGRSSTYGLKRWEMEKVDVKGGSIRGIVREFLLKAGGSMPLSAIMEEVLRYRKTNRSSVMTNLQLCEPEQFVFLTGDRVALVDPVPETEATQDLFTERLPLRKQDIKRYVGQPLAVLRTYLIDKLHHTEAEADRVIASRRSSGKLVVDETGVILARKAARGPAGTED